MSLEYFRKPLPEVWTRLWIVKYITDAKHCIYGVPSRDVEDSRNHIHTRP
jgi:hypothetical protein